MSIAIREMTDTDAVLWAEMRHALWPFTTADENRNDIAKVLAAPDEKREMDARRLRSNSGRPFPSGR